ncbi:MAG TPA: hypothetical protein VHT05_06320 [Candidatus Elarobacter sp.]|jgi:hypothetical protein|nr:hypothetical protein [Candidatus Elarobacter sp.]
MNARNARFATALAALLVFAGAAGCAKQEQSVSTTTTQTHRVLANPSDFPLYPQAGLVAVVPVDSAQMFAAIRKADPHASVPPKNYRGHEVIAQTTATMSQLSAWIATLRSTPPAGFQTSDHLDFTPEKNGGKSAVNGQEFDASAKSRAVYLVVADPALLRSQMGVVFDLIDGYAKVPPVLRGPLDEQAKQQMGYTVTEMLDVNSPIGAIVGAVKQLAGTNRRAILLIDESETK